MALQRIDWKWVFVSVVVFLVVQLALSLGFAIFGVMTFGFGFVLFLIVKPVTYFVGGIITGRVSPGVTIREPATGAVLVSVFGAAFDAGRIGGGRIVWIILASIVAFFLALAGAQIGERLQRSQR